MTGSLNRYLRYLRLTFKEYYKIIITCTREACTRIRSNMKILLVIDTERIPAHSKISNVYKGVLDRENEVAVIDMAAGKVAHAVFSDIVSYKSDLVITFDFAGFELKTELNMISYNTLTCRVAHILTSMKQDKDNMAQQLNLSHFVAVPKETDVEIFSLEHRNFPNVLYAPIVEEQFVSEWFKTARKEMWL